MFPGRKKDDRWLLRFDTAFQIFWKWVTNKSTPLHCGLTEMIHSLTKAKEIIEPLNRLGIIISYDGMKRTDVDIALDIISRTGDNRCPVGDNIIEGYPIQAAMDNFNHRERTPAGIEVADDTVISYIKKSQITACFYCRITWFPYMGIGGPFNID